MTRPQQPSILSFFQPKSLPQHATPPPGAGGGNTPPNKTGETTASPPAPPLPPPPSLATGSQRLPPAAAPVSITTTTITLPQKIPVLPSPPSLPSQASIVPLEEQHIPALRRINSLLLPVSYPDSFYSKILEPLSSGLFSRAFLWKDKDEPGAEAKVVGGVVCRLEPNQFVDPQTGRPHALPPPPPPKSNSTTTKPNQDLSTPPPPPEISSPFYAIYIQSLALLSPYRSQGLAAAALEHIVASAAILLAAGSSIDARTLYAHVWTENEEALRWYESRGFRREGRFPLQGYYFKLRPDTAWIMRRDIGPSALAAAPSSRSTSGVASPPVGNNVEIKPGVVAAAVNLPPISSSKPSPPAGGPPRSAPPRGLAATSASSAASSSLSFQNTRPETEWNDLPEDMVVPKPSASTGASNNSSSTNLLAPPAGPGGQGGSEASSRSSSVTGGGRKKERKRAYPAAAFGQ